MRTENRRLNLQCEKENREPQAQPLFDPYIEITNSNFVGKETAARGSANFTYSVPAGQSIFDSRVAANPPKSFASSIQNHETQMQNRGVPIGRFQGQRVRIRFAHKYNGASWMWRDLKDAGWTLTPL